LVYTHPPAFSDDFAPSTSFKEPGLPPQHHHCRIYHRDNDGTPTSTWYTDSSPTKESQNLLIPEFSDIAIPIAGIVAMFVIVRNVNGRKKRKKAEPQ
jgi:hypothetical protein